MGLILTKKKKLQRNKFNNKNIIVLSSSWMREKTHGTVVEKKNLKVLPRMTFM